MHKTYLAHHGILGQKWGVRRYQNADGTLTSSGKARYNDDGTKKKASQMSDDDLRKANSRLQAERQYNDLTKSKAKSTAVKIGASAVASMSAVAISDIVKNGHIGKKTVTKMLAAGALATIAVSAASVGGQMDRTYAGGNKDK